METTAAFKFRKLKPSEKVSPGDFISNDDGKTLGPLTGNSYTGLYVADFVYFDKPISIWRVTEQVS